MSRSGVLFFDVFGVEPTLRPDWQWQELANLRVRDLTWTPNVRFSFRSVLIVDLRSWHAGQTDRRGMLGKLPPTWEKNGYSD